MRSRTDFPEHCFSRLSLRARFAETDLMGVVHHAAYLTYFEAARVEYLRRRGTDYRELVDKGYHMPVVEAHLEYKHTARFDDELIVTVRLSALTRVTVRFDYEVSRGGSDSEVLVARGHTVLACVDESHRPRRIPRETADLLEGEERLGS